MGYTRVISSRSVLKILNELYASLKFKFGPLEGYMRKELHICNTLLYSGVFLIVNLFECSDGAVGKTFASSCKVAGSGPPTPTRKLKCVQK